MEKIKKFLSCKDIRIKATIALLGLGAIGYAVGNGDHIGLLNTITEYFSATAPEVISDANINIKTK